MTELNLIKELRSKTGCGILDGKSALAESNWDVDAAAKIIEKKRKNSPPKDIGFQAVFTYNHNNRIASIVVLGCNTDFVGKMEEFETLGKNIAQQIVGTAPDSVDDLLKQDFIKNPGVSIHDMIEEFSCRTQETVKILRLHREQV